MNFFKHPRLLRLTGVISMLSAGYLAGRLHSISSTGGTGSTDPEIRPMERAALSSRSSTASPRSAPRADDINSEWADILAKPSSAARELEMAEFLRRLAADDPEAALALAQQEGNFRVRQALVVAALQGWASRDSGAALAWAAGNLIETNRRDAIEAVIDVGLDRPDELIAAMKTLCEDADEGEASDYSRMLIAGLARRADFEGAMRFASGAPERDRNYLIGAAVYSWSQYQPEEAAAAADAIADPAARNEAMHGLILGWGSNNPESLLTYASSLPPGPTRTQAFNEALQNWVANDAAAAAQWLANQQSSPELDSGAVRLATSPSLIQSNVETALRWANNVSDPEQRSIALVDIVQQWAKRDPEAAKAYAAQLDDIQLSYQRQLMESLAKPAGSSPPGGP